MKRRNNIAPAECIIKAAQDGGRRLSKAVGWELGGLCFL